MKKVNEKKVKHPSLLLRIFILTITGMIMVTISALAGEKQIEKSTNTVVIGTELDYPPMK